MQEQRRQPEQIAYPRLDRGYLVDRLSMLARVPTQVPLGYETYMEPDDPLLVHYVQQVLRPEIARLRYTDLLDVARNNLVIGTGTGESDRVLLIQNYTPSHHHNLMADPFSGLVAGARSYGDDRPAVFGQGVSQCKSHQAVMLAVLKLLRDTDVTLRGRLYWAINNEGRSSHACSTAILGALDDHPSFAILQYETGLALTLGNRGRVDVEVHVRGRATHSSLPREGDSAIDGACEVLRRLKLLSWPDSHPLLGGRHAVPYKVRYEPIAPHTLPADAFITVDRRMIPGDDPVSAVAELREIIGDLSPWSVDVREGSTMLPALVDPSEPWVAALAEAHLAEVGAPPATVYSQGSFDAGYLCAQGVPTVMYGVKGGAGLLDTDFVAIADVEAEAGTLARLILDQLR